MAINIDELAIKITANDSSAVSTLNSIVNVLDKLSNTVAGINPSNIDKAADALSRMGGAFSKFGEGAKNLKNVTINIGNLGNASFTVNQAAKATEDLSDVAEQVAQEVGKASKVIEDTATKTESLAKASERAGNTIKILKAGFQGFTSTLKKISSMFGKIASKSFQAATNIAGFGKSSKSSKKNMAALAKELLRITKMLKLMVTRMVLRKVIQGTLDGFKNLAQYSKTFDATLSLLWNSFRQLGNSVAAAVSPLLNALAPALNTIIQLCIKAVNAINQLLSALTGLGTWTKAKTLTDSYAQSLQKASGAAKELKKTVLGFDELNQLQDNKNSGSGGTSAGNMFEDVPIDPKWKNFADWLKEMWDNWDFSPLGKLLGEKLLEALNNIPWDKIKRKARQIASSIATLINGFVETEGLGEAIGKTLAEAINTGFEFLNESVHKLHWKSIGKFIGDTFNGFFENIDWELIKDTVKTGFQGLADSIIQFILTFKWDNIGDAIANAVNALAVGITEFFNRPMYDERGFKMNGSWAARLGTELGAQIKQAINQIDFEEVGKAIGSILQSAFDFLAGIIDGLDFSDIIQALEDLLKGFFEEVNPLQVSLLVGDVLTVALLAGVGKIGTTVATIALTEKLKSLFAGAAGSEVVKGATSEAMGEAVEGAAGSKAVETAATGAGSKIAGFLKGGITLAIATWVGDKTIDGALSFWSESILKGMKEGGYSDAEIEKKKADLQFLEDRYDGLSGKLQIFKDGLKELKGESAFTLPSEEVENFGIAVEDCRLPVIHMGDSFNDLSISVEKSTGEIEKSVNSIKFEPLKKNVNELDGTIKKAEETTSQVTISIEQDWKGAQQSLTGTVQTISKDTSTSMTEVQKSVDDSMKEVNKSIDTVKDGLTEDKWTFKGVIDGLKNTFKDALKGAAEWWNKFSEQINGEHSIFGKQFSISLPKIQGFARGGFPEDGLFMANHGEMVGKFSNGRTAVANNAQITQGIAQAVFNAISSANSMNGGSERYINNTIYIGDEEVARAVTRGQEKIGRRYSPTMA